LSKEGKAPATARVVFLGGLGEIGRNCAAIEVDDQILIIDCGLMFPNHDTPGVDLILPDFTYLVENKDKVVGVVVTHGHEDHIGALPYLLREMSLDIYGSALALGLASNRIDEAQLRPKANLRTVSDLEKVKIGKFEVEFVPITHSVPDSFALVIRSSAGVIVHSGDFKIDLTPVDGRISDLARLGEISRAEGIDLLLADSTNAEEEGHSISESTIGPVLAQLLAVNTDKRIIVTCFASHVHRIQQIANAAIGSKRIIFPLGRSMGKNIALARSLGNLHLPDQYLDDIENVNRYEPEQVLVLSTGSQGEPLSALSLMSANENRFLKVDDGDVVIISADVIPGNESAVGKVIDGLHRRGAGVIHAGIAQVHTSGHAKRDELRLFHSILRPKNFVPVHGEYRHMTSHMRLAIDMGQDKGHTLVASDGDVVELSGGNIQIVDKVPADMLYVDGVIDGLPKATLRDRKTLSTEGFVVVVAAVDVRNKTLVGEVEIATRGWVHLSDDAPDHIEALLADIKNAVRATIVTSIGEIGDDVDSLARHVRTTAAKMIEKRSKMRPMVIPVITAL
jgi:ribonuclease J